VWAAAGAASSGEQSDVFTKGPYLQSPGDDTMTIMWESPVDGRAVVKYGRDGDLDQKIEVVKSFTLPRQPARRNKEDAVDGSLPQDRAYHFYEAVLTGLTPGATYRYRVELNGQATPAYGFRTFDRRAGKTTFIAYGDSRSSPVIHGKLAAQFQRHDPDFILHSGDIVARGFQYDLWKREFFDPLGSVLHSVPICPAIGNHEMATSGAKSAAAANYYRHYHLPGNEVFYSFDQGPVHVLVLDYRYERASHKQFAFAKQDLMESTAPWKIVQLHYPVFNFGGHTTAWGHATYLPLFHEAKVDLVVCGHSHLYERFLPVAPVEGGARWPITFITSGGGGANLYPAYRHPSLAAASMTNHYVAFEATANRLRGKAISVDGETLDEFELAKENGAYADAYARQATGEELLQLAFALKGPLTATFEDKPSTARAAAATFVVARLVDPSALARERESNSKSEEVTTRPISDAPLELEIELTAPSAEYYALENGPVRLTIPAGEHERLTATALVRSRGRRPIKSPSNVLDPGLVFQANVKTKWGDTIAFGGRSVVKKPEPKKAAEKTPARKRSRQAAR
jgi:hypothetical protein